MESYEICPPADREPIQARSVTVALGLDGFKRPAALTEHARIVGKALGWTTCACGHIFDASGDVLASSVEEVAEC